MNKFTNELYDRMVEQLNEVSRTSDNILQKAERSYKVIDMAMQEIKTFVLGHTFKSVADEVFFFKKTKPQFLKELIYYKEVFAIEAHKPMGSSELVKQHYDAEMERIRLYFIRNQELYNYYRMDKSFIDDQYFVRQTTIEIDANENLIDMDNRFCTVNSSKLAKLQAFEMLSEYLHKCIYKLVNPGVFTEEGNQRKFVNLWTDSKSALIEFAYGIYARGSVNNGKATISQIITDLSIVFNVELGNYHRTYHNMRIRKKNLTPYLDGMKESLVKRMDEDI